MANAFLANAQRQTTDVRTFLREAASDTNGIKYRAESGKRHQIYVPYLIMKQVDENGATADIANIIAINAPIHEWQGKDGKFKSMICLKDIFRKTEDGQTLNDGTCPICDTVGEGWDIYRYRYELEEKAAIARGLNGTQLEVYMKGDKKPNGVKGVNAKLLEDRKAREAKMYLYMVIVKYRLDGNGNAILSDKDKLPDFDIKVMKLSAKRAEDIMKTVTNSGGNFCGSELVFDYPVNDDVAQVVGQSTTAVVFPGNKLIDRHVGLLDKINSEVAKFSWDGIEKSFSELEGMTTEKAKEIMDDSFATWRKYQEELKVNPNAKYLEYSTAGNDRPAIGGVQMPQGGVQMNMNGGIPMPQFAGVQMPQAGVQMPQAGVQMPQAGVQMPQTGVQTPQTGVQMPQAGVQMPQAGVQMPQAQQAQSAPTGNAVQQFNGAGVTI